MPFYEFNQFSGRLKKSLNIQPLSPLKPEPLRGDPSPIVWDTAKTMADMVSAKPEAAAACNPKHPPRPKLPPKLIAKMIKFQADFDKPVFIAGGTPDKILFGITVALTIVGIAGVAEFAWSRAWKK